ncbi:MAG: heme-copper oxidase subunit III [Flavobacteriales bacterium]|nr:heme-copper oxidase subunit III [Flavobacteriales bacterium]
MQESIQPLTEKEITELKDKERNSKFILWLGIASMAMIFAALTSAFIVREGQKKWFDFELPMIFWYSTAVLLVSSITVNLARTSVKNNNIKAGANYLLITLALGAVFCIMQIVGWGELAENGIRFVDPNNLSGSFFIVITGTHLAHLAGGLISLFYTWIQALRGKYSPQNHLGIKLTAIFWHFLDFLWLYLFVFLVIKS